MHKSGGVDDLNYAAQLHGAALIVRKELGGEEQQRWTNTLSSSGTKMFADICDRRDSGDGIATEFTFNSCQIVAQQLKNFFYAARSW